MGRKLNFLQQRSGHLRPASGSDRPGSQPIAAPAANSASSSAGTVRGPSLPPAPRVTFPADPAVLREAAAAL
eukprot:14655961-Alexandrium_andersonii.AAC.1